MNDLYVALVHYPVVNKRGKTIASALTTIDLHDIARASMTYGVQKFFVVTPLEDQKILAEEVMAHWVSGIGAQLNPDRKRALELVSMTSTFEEAVGEIERLSGKRPVCAATSAADHPGAVTLGECVRQLRNEAPLVLAFGTAWGLSPDFIDVCDVVLEPVRGAGDYNHLSVRSAVSIILDRLSALVPANGGKVE